MQRLIYVVAVFLVGSTVTAAISGCTAVATHEAPDVAIRTASKRFSFQMAVPARVFRAIAHRARIYKVRVLRREPLPSAAEWSDVGYVVARVERAVYGPARHELRIYYGTRTMSVAMPERPFCEPPSRALKPGRELLVILYPTAYASHSSVLDRVGSTRIWVLWGRGDPFVQSVDNLVGLIRQKTGGGGRHKNIVIDSAIRAADAQVDLWARCHSNCVGITSADDALKKVAKAFDRQPLGQSAMVIGVQTAPTLVALDGTKPAARCRLVAAVVAATLAAPPVDRPPLARCLGKIVIWDDAPAANSCMTLRQRRRLDLLLTDMIIQATARPELTRFLRRDLAWLRRDEKE